MKQIFTTIIALILSFSGFAQFKPVSGAGHTWSNVAIHCQPEGNSYSSSKLATGSDTTFGDFIYHTVWQTSGSTPVYYGSLRDDTATGRTWYRFPFSDTDGLIYDFSLLPGDTATLVNQFLWQDTIRLIVTGRDSVLMNDQWRTRITLNNFELSLQEWWIEGIGSKWGVLNAGNSFNTSVCGSEELLCFWENDVQLFQNQSYYVCEFGPAAISETYNNENLVVYPVPATETLYLSGVWPGTVITLSDPAGRVLIRTTAPQPDLKLDVSGLKPGFYVLTAESGAARISRTIVTSLR